MKKLQVTPCPTWARKLVAVHPDDLSVDERAELNTHIASCAACAAVLNVYRQIDAYILSLPPIQPLSLDPEQLPPRKGEDNSGRTTNNGRRVWNPAIHERKIIGMKSTTSSETHHHSPVESSEKSPTSRKARFIRAVSSIAAILVVGALVASFLILLSHRSPAPGGPVSNTPPAAPLAVYVGLNTKDGTAYALRPTDGSILWQRRIDQGGQNFAQEPTISHGIVYFSSNNGSIYALRASDGALLWHHALGGIPDQPVGSNGTIIYIGTLSGAVYALRTSDGSQVWRHSMSIPNAFVLAVIDGRVYAYSDGLYVLRASDGSVIWRNEMVKFASRSLVVSNGKVYIPSLLTGIEVLRASDGLFLRLLPMQGELASANGNLYISGSEVYALRTSDDSTIWHVQSDCLTGRLSLSNGVIYMSVSLATSNSDSKIIASVCALRTSDGKQLWRWHSSTVEGITIPRVVDGRVYINVGVSEGNTADGLYALSASDGTVLWHVFQGQLLAGPAVG
jgi:outer membrane protein assembly factor BamB